MGCDFTTSLFSERFSLFHHSLLIVAGCSSDLSPQRLLVSHRTDLFLLQLLVPRNRDDQAHLRHLRLQPANALKYGFDLQGITCNQCSDSAESGICPS